MTADELRRFGTEALAACCDIVKAPPAVVNVIKVGRDDPSRGHAAFDAVRELTLRAAARDHDSAPLGLLYLAENVARVIYNSTTPDDPFDADAEELVFRSIAGFFMSLTLEARDVLAPQLCRVVESTKALAVSVAEMQTIRAAKLAARWFVGDPEACRAMAVEMTADQLRIFSIDALAACCAAVGGTPVAVLRVVEIGREAPRLGRVAFDAVQELRLAAEAASQPVTPSVRVLRVAEGAARVIYNSTTPDDPFDTRSGAWLLQTVAGLWHAIDVDGRRVLFNQLLVALTAARSVVDSG